jgi:hypothetical protein
MNVFDRQDKWLMRLCFGIAVLMLLSAIRYMV